MSLVHPSVIETLNRRFVSTYFNTFEGPGHDSEASKFAELVMKKAGIDSLQYGAIVTPDGTLVNRFDFAIEEVAQCMAQALEQNPRFDWLSKEESQVLKLADLEPGNVQANLAAAQLWCGLLQFDRARALLTRLQASALSPGDRAGLTFAKAQIGSLQILNRNTEAIKRELLSIETVDPKLLDEIALELVSLQVIERAQGPFFKGSQLRSGSDAASIAAGMEGYLEKDPNAARAGEALFYLGLARMESGDTAGANAAWKEHYTRLPDDRLALASRLHHTEYKFSPLKKSTNVFSGNAGDPNMLANIIKQMEAQGITLTAEQVADMRKQLGLDKE